MMDWRFSSTNIGGMITRIEERMNDKMKVNAMEGILDEMVIRFI